MGYEEDHPDLVYMGYEDDESNDNDEGAQDDVDDSPEYPPYLTEVVQEKSMDVREESMDDVGVQEDSGGAKVVQVVESETLVDEEDPREPEEEPRREPSVPVGKTAQFKVPSAPHLRAPVGEKTVCPICDRKFARASVVYKHMRNTHKCTEDIVKEYMSNEDLKVKTTAQECPYCHIGQSNLSNHLKTCKRKKELETEGKWLFDLT